MLTRTHPQTTHPNHTARTHSRPRHQLLDEFLTAVRRRYGNTTLIHFEDMGHDNGAKLLNMYRTDFPCYNDDLQVIWRDLAWSGV